MRKRAAAALLDSTPLGALLRRVDAWHGTLVLAYHRIGDSAASLLDRGVFSASPAELDTQLRFLCAHFDVVDPLEVVSPCASARGRRVVVTFDDGYRDNWASALPILRHHGVRAAFFIATGLVDRPRIPWWDEIAWMVRASPLARIGVTELWEGPLELGLHGGEAAIDALLAAYKRTPARHGELFLERLAEATLAGRCPLSADRLWMTWDEVRDLRDAGMRIGGHTVSHPILARLEPLGQEVEILGCQARMERELGEPMRLFSYPVGLPDCFDRHSRAILRRAGVKLAFACAGGWLGKQELDPLAIPRTPVGPGTGGRLLCAVATLPQAFARP